MASKGKQFSMLLLFKVLLLLFVVFIILTLATHHALSSMAVSESPVNSHKTRTQLEYDNDHDSDSNSKLISSYQNDIEELRKIKISVNNELRNLENHRLKLQSDITSYTSNIDRLITEQSQLNKEVQQIRLALKQIRFEQEESKSFIPNIKAPIRVTMEVDPMEMLPMPSGNRQCHMESCFDFSRCSLVSGFPVYFYDPDKYFMSGLEPDPYVSSSYFEFFHNNVYRTLEPHAACVFVVLVGEIRQTKMVKSKEIESFLTSLPYWRGDGRNHILVNLGRSLSNVNIFDSVNTGRAMVAQSFFTYKSFRTNFDLLLPVSMAVTPVADVWKDVPLLSPVRRKYLMTFWGQYFPGNQELIPRRNVNSNTNTSSLSSNSENIGKHFMNRQRSKLNNVIQRDRNSNDNNFNHRQRHLLSVDDWSSSSQSSLFSHIEQSIILSLKSFQSNYPEKFHTEVSCNTPISDLVYPSIVPSDWLLCQPNDARKERILESTFNLIIPPLNSSFFSTVAFQIRVFETLQNGAIPVIIGSHGHLPFSEVLQWEKAAIILPTPRVTEIPFFLLSIPDEDISSYRLQGRHFYLNHFSSVHSILNSVLAVVRTRLQIPARPIKEEEYKSAFPVGFTPLKFEGPEPELETDEVLGPVESPFPSETFKRNFTSSVLSDPFNNQGDPFHLYPSTPFHSLLPSEAKFLGSNYGFRPVAQGAGGDGVSFSQALGGNSPREQFTIVMLTYDREVVLMQALQRFKSLPYLNKVVVVWNNPEPPANDLRWPDIGVPIQVAKTKQNSLNNRFLPYEVIETEAILSIDDDAHLRHDEIVFGFRVWREERGRVVGFPGRFHAWDVKHKSWNYNSNYSCELSMVLTGAAFFHKYYAYQYSYVMPQAIRDKVDEFMNCEDIAMNFLVAHITRKSPIKLTSRWTFRCPLCQSTLSSNSTHFEERHQCINFFTQVYGYMPLLYTQYRVDSVLFKTRISHTKAKCFKYI